MFHIKCVEQGLAISKKNGIFLFFASKASGKEKIALIRQFLLTHPVHLDSLKDCSA